MGGEAGRHNQHPASSRCAGDMLGTLGHPQKLALDRIQMPLQSEQSDGGKGQRSPLMFIRLSRICAVIIIPAAVY